MSYPAPSVAMLEWQWNEFPLCQWCDEYTLSFKQLRGRKIVECCVWCEGSKS